MAFATALERVLTTAWVGGMWVVGFVVAPALFSVLSRVDAGRAAALVFHRLNLLGLMVGASLIALWFYRRGRGTLREWRFWLVLAMIALTAVNEFGIATAMQSLRGADGAVLPQMRPQFGVLHGISTAIFLVISLLGLALVLPRAGHEKAQ